MRVSSRGGANGRAKGNLDVNMLLQLEKAEKNGPSGAGAGAEGQQANKEKGEGSEEVLISYYVKYDLIWLCIVLHNACTIYLVPKFILSTIKLIITNTCIYAAVSVSVFEQGEGDDLAEGENDEMDDDYNIDHYASDGDGDDGDGFGGGDDGEAVF